MNLKNKSTRLTKPYEQMIENLTLFLTHKIFNNDDNEFLHQLKLIPRRFSKFGDMIVFNEALENFLSSDLYLRLNEENKKTFWSILTKSLKSERIAMISHIKHGSDVREPVSLMLHGSSSVVTYLENRILFEWDLCEVMFSRGNISEKLRLSKINCEGEVIVDMFAGIGYFSLTYLLHCRPSLLYACEWNKNAVFWLKKNLENNNIDRERYKVLEGDCRIVSPRGVAQRVNLGLIPNCRDCWRAACETLCHRTGGVLHIHENVDSKQQQADDGDCDDGNIECNTTIKRQWTHFALDSQKIITDILRDIHQCHWKVSIKYLHQVKSYGPHIDHFVLDLDCRPPTII